MILFYDTETTGFPSRKPNTDPSQPHIVSIGAILTDGPNIVKTMEVMVKPMGWTIHPSATRVHGITDEMAQDTGIPEGEALSAFMGMASLATLRVAYNEKFDSRIIEVAMARHGARPSWNLMSAECAMELAAKHAGASISLSNALKRFLNTEHADAHNALSDTMATFKLYRHLKALQPAQPQVKTKAKPPKAPVSFYAA